MNRFDSIDAYIAAQPENAQAPLERVRSILRKALPKAEETISYSMPAFRLAGGRVIVYFAAWKNHLAFYPGAGHVTQALKDELAPYEVTKGTIKFPLSEPVPAKLITKIAKLRLADEQERAAAKRTR